MAKRSFSIATFTTAAFADTSTMSSNNYAALQGGSSTQSIRVSELYMGGQATSSAPQYIVVGRDSTIGATPTALSAPAYDAPLNPATAALAAPAVPFVAATTNPQRSSSLHLLSPSFNANGGLTRWVAYPDEEIWILGNSASNGEISISGYTGTTAAAVSLHLVYEPI